jgi:hypothetical protein
VVVVLALLTCSGALRAAPPSTCLACRCTTTLCLGPHAVHRSRETETEGHAVHRSREAREAQHR